MEARATVVEKALRRMLSNGPLTAVPKRREDEELLMRLAAARFEAGREYTEAEVNEVLEEWLATFCAPYGIDHVTLRRALVDSRLLRRDTAGAAYRVDSSRLPALREEARVAGEPARVMAQIREERAARKRDHLPGAGLSDRTD
ncbi:MAG TPA: DUF2087 domain-containing protein [Usitatibacter sp.]|nr:DUF2087 domain-containing protein [Usitatibacter sp.]